LILSPIYGSLLVIHFSIAILQASPSIFDTVSDEMILDIDIFCLCMVLRAVGKCNGALVVAVDDVLIADIVANLFEES
jgi:hypothetical protein